MRPTPLEVQPGLLVIIDDPASNVVTAGPSEHARGGFLGGELRGKDQVRLLKWGIAKGEDDSRSSGKGP